MHRDRSVSESRGRVSRDSVRVQRWARPQRTTRSPRSEVKLFSPGADSWSDATLRTTLACGGRHESGAVRLGRCQRIHARLVDYMLPVLLRITPLPSGLVEAGYRVATDNMLEDDARLSDRYTYVGYVAAAWMVVGVTCIFAMGLSVPVRAVLGRGAQHGLLVALVSITMGCATPGVAIGTFSRALRTG